ncbi:MAG: hypothetical protein M3O32_12660 [Actinomycetota bacterium]|nr:hypothetical protein [Actinomycetota bacterium]
MWFIRSGPRFAAIPFETRVLVDPGDTGNALTSIRRMINQVNRCSHDDAIVDRHQPFGDQSTHLHDGAGPSKRDVHTIAEASRW